MEGGKDTVFKRIKKFHIFHHLAALMLACMVLMGFTQPVHAAETGTCGSDLTWSLSRGCLSITGSGAMTDFTDENMPPWYEVSQEITRVTIGDGVTRVGSLAFYGCSKLKSVSLPSSLTEIGARAFKACTSLSYIGFPSSLELIGDASFEECEDLSGIRLPDSLTVIGDYAFYRCYSLTSITVPSSVRSFGMVVFAYCENLTQATVKCSLSRLPDWTFYGCRRLQTVVLPETVSSTGEYAFHDCDNLTRIHYSGDSADSLLDDIKKDHQGVADITSEEHDGTGSSGSFTLEDDGSVGKSETISVKETDNVLIQKDVDTTSNFQLNGEDATFQEIAQAGEDAEIASESSKTVTITSTVDNSDGWTELAEEVKEAVRIPENNERMEVSVQIPDSTVKGSDLEKFAGQDVLLDITTNEGDTWKIDASSISEKDVEKRDYDLSVKVTEEKPGKTKIESDTVFKVKFRTNTDFCAAVGIQVGNPYQLATLYKKSFMSYDEIQTVVVDADGIAWFTFANVEKRGNYYVGINVDGKTEEDAIVPATLYDEYGIEDEEATLTDANGVSYKITGRSSSWGITGVQFAIYIVLAIGMVILIVALGMFTWNKIQKSKEKYAIDDEDAIDEDELRMEIMRELLEQSEDEKKQ